MNRPVHEWRRGAFRLTTDPARTDAKTVQAFLTRSYWARGIDLATVRRALANSIAFALLEERDGRERQVGGARVISDLATFAHMKDVWVDEDRRGRGLGKWMIERVLDHRDLRDLPFWSLKTEDAHGLYFRFGFEPPARPELTLERARSRAGSPS